MGMEVKKHIFGNISLAVKEENLGSNQTHYHINRRQKLKGIHYGV